MKTKDGYIFPETPEELSVFYGWEAERLEIPSSIWPNGVGQEEYYSKKLFKLCLRDLVDGVEGWLSDYDSPYRIPLPRLSDLVVGDVVRNPKSSVIIELNRRNKREVLSDKEYLDIGLELLVSRGVWVEVLP